MLLCYPRMYYNTATTLILNLIWIIHSCTQDSQVKVRAMVCRWGHCLLLLPPLTTSFTPLCLSSPHSLPGSLFSNTLTSLFLEEYARSFAFAISFWNSLHCRYAHGSLPHLLQFFTQISLLTEAFFHHSIQNLPTPSRSPLTPYPLCTYHYVFIYISFCVVLSLFPFPYFH